MASDFFERIRERAYQIWEGNGRDARHEEGIDDAGENRQNGKQNDGRSNDCAQHEALLR